MYISKAWLPTSLHLKALDSNHHHYKILQIRWWVKCRCKEPQLLESWATYALEKRSEWGSITGGRGVGLSRGGKAGKEMGVDQVLALSLFDSLLSPTPPLSPVSSHHLPSFVPTSFPAYSLLLNKSKRVLTQNCLCSFPPQLLPKTLSSTSSLYFVVR